MKIVVLWAGMGRRIQDEYAGMHKALIPLNGEPLLIHLLRNIERAGFTEIVPILGYESNDLQKALDDYIFKSKYVKCNGGLHIDKVELVYNSEYAGTNNLYSLICAKDKLNMQDFIVINGDMVFDYRILRDIGRIKGNAIAVDINKYPTQLDSPRVLIENERILDIGRHRRIEDATGYAVGIYKFASTFSEEYFEIGEKICKERPQAGYHEPLELVLSRIEFFPSITKQYSWMDVDEKQDVKRAERMLLNLR